MKVDYVLILAAGKGTRMGKIGEVLPKVIWPIFNKSILELEYLYAKQFSDNVYINLYNYKDIVAEHISKSNVLEKANVLIEDQVLDIGGAVHNLASTVGYKGKLLVINSDQFIMLTKNIWENFYNKSNDYESVILTYNVKATDMYNSTVAKNGKLLEVVPNEKLERDTIHETYTGMSIINLEKLEPINGESRFFDSVANYNKYNVGTINMDDCKYWDFGTIRRYYSSMFNILSDWKKDDDFIGFLKNNNVLDERFINGTSYKSELEKVINLSNQSQCQVNTIYLGDSKAKIPDTDCIVMGDLIEIVNYPKA